MDDLQKITGLTPGARNELCGWYGKMTEAERLDTHKLKADLLRQHHDQYQHLGIAERTYGALCYALHLRQQTLAAASRRSVMSLGQAAQITKMRRDAIKKPAREGKVARLIRLRWLHEIKSLRAEGYSWRDVSAYIARYHKRQVSYVYLQKVYEQLTLDDQGGQP